MTYPFHMDPAIVADEGDEMAIQVRLRARCRIVAPSVRLVGIPNAGKRTAWAAMKAKNEGLAKGFPDIHALWAGGDAYLEMKDRTGRLAPEQIDWLNWLHTTGKPCGCFRSVDTALAFLQRHGAPILKVAA